MWVMRLLRAPRELLERLTLLLVTSGIVASFAVIGPLSQSALAVDAAWEGGSIRYDTQLYAPESSTDPPTPLDAEDPRNREGKVAYTWIETLDNGSQRAHTIFLDDGFARSEEQSALLITYTYRSPNVYTNPSAPTTVNIAGDPTAPATEQTASAGECSVAAIGWILCPASRWLAEGVDVAYGLIRQFLEVPTITTDTKTGLYTTWGIARSIANVCLIIVMLAIIYSQLTSAAIGNYGIKVMLPRLLIGAILINVSFWLSALAVDISNVLGHSIHAVFENIRTNIPQNIEVTWSALTIFILSGGTAVGALAIVGAVAGSVLGLGFMLISALISVAFGVFVAFVILAARQALITILIIISPLAFIAYILPSTQHLFNRWRKSFTTLLVFFPLFGLLFGGSSLAGAVIMNTADDRLHIVLLGLAVQFIPLVITPLLIQFSTGLLGRIAGLAKGRPGFVNSAKGWARNHADYHKDRALGQGRVFNPLKLAARSMDRNNRARETRREGYKANADHMARRTRDRKTGEWRDRRNWVQSDILRRQATDAQKAAETRNASQYAEFSAYRSGDPNAVNPYNVHEGIVRKYASKPTFRGSPVFTRSSEDILNDHLEANRDLSNDLMREVALSGTRKTMADRKYNEILARELTDNTITIDGKDLQQYAAGIMGETGRNSIVASAKSTVSEADLKDAANIQAAIPFEIQNNNQRLRDKFLAATTMTERLAYANQLESNGGPGFATLRETLKQWEASGQYGQADISTLKELLKTNGKIMSGGKDLETWITDENNAPLTTISDDVNTWKNLSASAFASMNNSSQRYALELMQRQNRQMYDEYRQMLREDSSTLANVKREIRAAHDLL